MSNANVTNANISCTTNTYALGGQVTGLVAGNITLTNTVNSDVISVPNGNYVFDQNIAYTGNYNVVATSPAGLSCTVSNGNATMPVGGNTNVNVACTAITYTLGGSVSGLLSNTNVSLKNGNDTILPVNGNFTFPMGVAYNSNFNVSLTNPNGQTCVFVSNSNAGVMPASNDMNVQVSCSTNTYTLGGSITGLLTNTNVTLADGNDTISRTNGSYIFPTLLPYGRAYSVGLTNPSGQTCVFSPNAVGSGTMGAAPVTNANVVCTTNTYALGGAVTGLVTGNVTLTNAVNADVISVGNGNYLFDQNVVYGGNYNVVATSPAGLTCSVSNGNAVMPVGGNFNVNVACVPNAYVLGGAVSGLLANSNVTLKNANDTILPGNGNFTFPTGVAYNSNFSASLVNPNGQTCVFVSNSNAGVMPPSNDMNIVVSCTTNLYALGGSISGLLTNTNVTLADGNDTVARTNGTYSFPTSLPYGRIYSIGISNPNGQTCVFSPNSVGSGTMSNANVTNANITCTTNTYAFGGRVTGLVTGNITLTNTANADVISVPNGNYVFDQNVAYTGNYNVVATSPAGLSCIVSNGNGAMPVGGNTNVNVACTAITYTLGGSVSGLLSNTNVTLKNGNDTILPVNGNFTFPTGVAYNSNFSASLINPNGQTCVFVSNSNTGVMPASNNMNIVVSCTTNLYALGGSISGLLTNTNVTLADGNDTVLRANGTYSFPTSLPYGRAFSIGIVNPNGQTCVFSPNSVGSGTIGNANVTNANIVCTTNTYALGGNVTGLISGNVTLTNTINSDAISVGNGNYFFDQNVAYLGNYNVVSSQPAGMACTVINPNGAMPIGGVFNVNVSCMATTHTLGGTVAGLMTNTNVTLMNGNDTILSTNGNFTFPTNVATNSNFNVSLVNPNGQTCVFVSNSNAGIMPAVNDMNVVVTCSTNTYTLGGSITGLLTNTNVTLADANDTISRTNGAYIFPTMLPYGRAYTINITNPVGQTCVFSPNTVGSGVMGSAPVTNANVVCTTNTYPLGGRVTGLVSGNVTLTNTINSDALVIGNGNYLFNQNVVYLGNYNVVAASPNGQFCTVTNGNATMPVGGNFNVMVNCAYTTATYLVLSNYSTPRTAGQNSNINITAYDTYNNVAIGYTGTVHLLSTDANATFSPNITFVTAYAGSANVPITMKTAGTQTMTGNDTVTASIAGQQNSIIVNPNIATRLSLTNYTTPRTAGTNSNLTITALDAYSNVATGYTGTVHLTVSDANAIFSPNLTFVSGYAGVGNVPLTMTTVGTWAITGNDTVTSSIAGALTSIVVTPANANRYVFTGYPSVVMDCTQANVSVKVLDAYGNTATGYTGTIDLSSSDSNAITPANYTFVAGDAGLKPFPVTMKTTGTWNISGNDTVTPAISGAQSGIIVNANRATYLSVTNFPSPVIAGTQGNVTITARDTCGNIDPNYTGTVRLTSTDTNAILPANYNFTLANAGVVSRAVTLRNAGNQNINANDTTTASIAGSQNVFVNPNVTTHYLVAGYPSQVNIATQANVSITAYDQYGNMAYNYTGTVAVRSSDGNATLPANRMFAAGDSGTVVLPVKLNSFGKWVISANDTVQPLITGAEPNILVAFTPMNTTPSGISALTGVVWHGLPQANQPPSLTDLITEYTWAMSATPNDLYVDSYINTTRHYQLSNNSSTVAYLGSDANGQSAADTGSVGNTGFMFTGYMIVSAGGNYTLSMASADDGAFVYLGGAEAGGNSTMTNLVNYNSSLTTAPGFSNPATVSLNQAGAYPITIWNHNMGGGIGLDFNMYGPGTITYRQGPAAWAGTATTFAVSLSPNPIVAGNQGNVTFTPLDANGNVLTNYKGLAVLTATDQNALLADTYSFVSSSSVTLPIVFRTAGTWAISANDSIWPPIAGQMTNAVVTSNPNAVYLTVNYNNVVAGSPNTVRVTAINSSGATATNYRGTIAITSGDGNAVLPANRTFLAADNGVVTLSVTLKAITNAATITATDTNNANLFGSITTVVVYPAPNATNPGGTAGLTGKLLHRGSDTSLGIPASLSDMYTAANYLYSHTVNYSFTNTHINTAQNINYSGSDTSLTNSYLNSDAAGSASSDSNSLQSTYLDYAGYMKTTTGGNFTFTLTADDGALVYLGGGTAPGTPALILANNYIASISAPGYSNPATLYLPAAGYYPIELFYQNEYSNNSGSASLFFQVTGPGTISFVTGSPIGFFSISTPVEELDKHASVERKRARARAAPPPAAPTVTLQEPQWLRGGGETLENGGSPMESGFVYMPSRDSRGATVYGSKHWVRRGSVPSPDAIATAIQGVPVLAGDAHDTTESRGVALLNAMRKEDGSLVGLYRRTGVDPNGAGAVHTSAIAWSADDGQTWSKQGMAVGRPYASRDGEPEPEILCMIHDPNRQRWLGIGHGRGYASYDPNAAPGTWYGWYEGAFEQPEPDIFGDNLAEPLPGLSEDMQECKLHYNSYLDAFVLLWRPWDGQSIMQSYSRDGVGWSTPTVLLHSDAQATYSHAQIIGKSDVLHGRRARLVYQRHVPGRPEASGLVVQPIAFEPTQAAAN